LITISASLEFDRPAFADFIYIYLMTQEENYKKLSSSGGGLFLMAIFTLSWSLISFFQIDRPLKFLLSFLWVLAAVFLFKSFQLDKMASLQKPKVKTIEDNKRKKYFYLIFILEGLGIFIGINVANNIGHPDLTISVIALVVGLHFFPLAWIFQRKVDIYIATWSTLIALLAMATIIRKPPLAHSCNILLPVGMALSTAAYGFYMMYQSRQIIA
jgi:hypothetical protein